MDPLGQGLTMDPLGHCGHWVTVQGVHRVQGVRCHMATGWPAAATGWPGGLGHGGAGGQGAGWLWYGAAAVAVAPGGGGGPTRLLKRCDRRYPGHRETLSKMKTHWVMTQ